MMCKLVGLCIEVTVGQLLLLKDQSNGVRAPLHLLCKQLRETGLGITLLGDIPPLQQGALGLRDQRQGRKGLIGLLHQGLQNLLPEV